MWYPGRSCKRGSMLVGKQRFVLSAVHLYSCVKFGINTDNRQQFLKRMNYNGITCFFKQKYCTTV